MINFNGFGTYPDIECLVLGHVWIVKHLSIKILCIVAFIKEAEIVSATRSSTWLNLSRVDNDLNYNILPSGLLELLKSE